MIATLAAARGGCVRQRHGNKQHKQTINTIKMNLSANRNNTPPPLRKYSVLTPPFMVSTYQYSGISVKYTPNLINQHNYECARFLVLVVPSADKLTIDLISSSLFGPVGLFFPKPISLLMKECRQETLFPIKKHFPSHLLIHTKC